MDLMPSAQRTDNQQDVTDKLEARLDALERRYRYVQASLALLLLAGATLFTTGFSPRVPETIQAHEFEVVDDSGFVQGRLSAGNGYGTLRLGSPGVRGKRIYINTLDEPQILLSSGNMNEPGNARLDLTPRKMYTRGPNGTVSVQTDSIGPRVILADENWWFKPDSGYRAVLGAVRLRIIRSGTKIERTPGSLVLFDDEQKVLWSAPSR